MAEGVAGQVRHAFTLMALTAPLEDRFSAGLWGKLRVETEHACAAAALLLLELRYPAEQMRPVGRMIRSHLRATHATGLEALDNLVHLEGKRHLLALIGDLSLEEKRRYALRRLGIAGASGPEAALERLAEFPDGLINFWARVETRRRLASDGRRAHGERKSNRRALTLAQQPAGPTVPLIAPLIFPEREDEALELAQKIETLRATPIFGALSEDELKIIALCLREQRFEAAQVICEAGQSGEAVYILVEGRVELVTEAAPPRRQMLEPGEVFGEVALLAGEPYSLTAVAATRVALLSLDRETLRELIGYYPQIAGDLMRTLALRLNQANGSTQKEWL